jgi:hypothetical protein
VNVRVPAIDNKVGGVSCGGGIKGRYHAAVEITYCVTTIGVVSYIIGRHERNVKADNGLCAKIKHHVREAHDARQATG